MEFVVSVNRIGAGFFTSAPYFGIERIGRKQFTVFIAPGLYSTLKFKL